MKPTRAQMERVLLQYGRCIREGDGRNRPNTVHEVERYCRALKRVWNMAVAMAKAKEVRHAP